MYDTVTEDWQKVIGIAGQRAARVTQLDPTGIFTREFFRHPLGSIMLQYKSFAFNQAKFMIQNLNPKRVVREILTDPSMTANQKGIAFADYIGKVVAYQLAGEAIGDVRAMIINLFRDKKIVRSEDLLVRMAENFMYVGGLGIVTDVAHIAGSGSELRALQTIVGPTGSDLVRGAAGDLGDKASVVIEKIPIPGLNKGLADIARGR